MTRILLTLIVLTLYPLTSLSDTSVFTAPFIAAENKIQPEYPRGDLYSGKEGWVLFNVVVDEEGTPREANIVDYSATQDMKKAARKALMKSKFTPGKLNGQSIESTAYFRYSFSIEGGVGASRSFRRLYKKFNKHLDKQNIQTAQETLSELEEKTSLNNYERAFINFSKFRLAFVKGEQKNQPLYLNRALGYESKGKDLNYLSEELRAIARRQLFILQVEQKHYADALSTYEEMNKNQQKEDIELFKDTYQAIKTLKSDDQTFSIREQLDDRGFLFHSLIKNSISIFDAQGELNELRLRCQKKYVYFDYSPNKQWNIPNEWGECTLQVIGEPKAEFTLWQG